MCALCRVQRAKGIRGGASPLLLPDYRRSTAAAAAAGGISQLIGGTMPSDPVLQRSEFLYPLDAQTEQLYIELLSGL